jgi:hypothetical protein
LFWFPQGVLGKELYQLLLNRVKRFLLAKFQEKEGEGSVFSPQTIEEYPFVLKLVSQTGMECGRCSKLTSSCSGCLIPFSEDTVKLKSGITVTLEWTLESHSKFYDTMKAEVWFSPVPPVLITYFIQLTLHVLSVGGDSFLS